MASRKNSGFSASVTVDGKRERASGFKTEAAAHLWELKAKAAMLEGRPVPPGPAQEERGDWTLKEMLEWAYEVHWAKLGNPKYFSDKISAVVRDMGEKYLAADAATPEGHKELKAAAERAGNGGSTINRKSSLVSKAVKLAIEHGKLQGISKPQFGRVAEGPSREFIISPELEGRCAEWLGQFTPDTREIGSPEALDWFTLCIDTGMRVYSEALHVYPHVDLAGKMLTIRGRLLELAPNVTVLHSKRRVKTGENKSRRITLTERSLAIVQRRMKNLGPNDPLFHGTPLKAQALIDLWKRMNQFIKVNDPDFVPYSLRHTCLTRLFLAGADFGTVMDWAGHTNPKQTWKYVHLAGTLSGTAATKLDAFLSKGGKIG